MAEQTKAEPSLATRARASAEDMRSDHDGLWLPDDEPLRKIDTPTPYQISRTQTACLILIAVGVVFYALYSARALVFPIVLSLVIALPLRPLVRTMRNVGLPSAIGALLVVSVLIVAVISGATMLWEPARGWMNDSKAHLAEAEQKLKDIRKPLDDMQEAGKNVESITDAASDPTTLKVEVKQPSLTNTVLSTTGTVLIGGTVAISLVFLLLAFGDCLLDAVVAAMPTRGDRENIRHMTIEAERTISRYLLSYSAINIGLGTVIGLGMWAIGMPNPLLWGVMAALLNFVPFLGLAVGSAVVFLVAIISFDTIGAALLAPAIYLAANGLEANIITPMLLGRSLRLNAIIIFLFIILWGFVWGIGGAIIAVPLLIIAKVICDHVRRLQPLGRLLAS